MSRIIVICPEAHVGDANQWMMALGSSVEAWQHTFATMGWQAGSALQSLASWDATDDWLAAVLGVPERPAWDVDNAVNMAAAARAQALVVLYDPESDDPVPQASASTILILLGDPMAMAAAAGLVRIGEGDT